MLIEAYITESFEDAIAFCTNNKVDVLISDLNIGTESGFDVIDAANKNPNNSELKSFICSAESPVEFKAKMKESKVYGWILKPVETNSFRKVLAKLLA